MPTSFIWNRTMRQPTPATASLAVIERPPTPIPEKVEEIILPEILEPEPKNTNPEAEAIVDAIVEGITQAIQTLRQTPEEAIEAIPTEVEGLEEDVTPAEEERIEETDE